MVKITIKKYLKLLLIDKNLLTIKLNKIFIFLSKTFILLIKVIKNNILCYIINKINNFYG